MSTFDDLTNNTEAVSVEEKRIALVVGTNNTKASSYLPDLKYAEDDAQEVYHTLRQPACNFEFICPVLTGEKAETRDVRRAVIRLAQEKADQNFLLFYFIGHAQPMKTKEGYDDIYLVTHDFNENETKEDSTSHLSMRWLRNMLYRSDGAGRVLIILDCCYAGNIIHVGSDYSRIDLHTFIKGCIDGTGNIHQNGRLRVLLTATGYNTPAQERVMTNLFLSVLQGKVAQVIDHKGDVNIHSLYTYLQDQMPLAQLPNLSGDFPMPCILAHYPEKSHVLQFNQQAEENDRWHTVSQLMDKMSEISSVITDSDYFRRLAEGNARHHVYQFDRVVDETAFIDDLNQDKVAEFLKRDRVQIQDDFYPESTQQDHLQHLGFLQGLHPTHGALLCFGVNPTKWLAGAFTHCTLWRGNDQSNGWLDAQDYRRGLIAQFEAGRDLLRRSLRLARSIRMDERIEELEVPLVALEEALANALVHREYANQPSPVYIDIFNSRIEISSPGVPPEPMTMELLKEDHKSHPRNPQIARIFYLYQYVEKVGSGIQRMQQALANAGLPPAKFELGKDRTFKVIFYRPEQALEETIQPMVNTTVPTKVFYACAYQDVSLQLQLEKHLHPLEQTGFISQWSELRLQAGADRTAEVQKYLKTASIIFLLISADFFASENCINEMEIALERYRRGEVLIIPILLRPVAWQESPIGSFSCLPRDGRPITTWVNQDEAFSAISREVRRVLAQPVSFNSTLSKADQQNRLRILRRVQRSTEEMLEVLLHRAPLIVLGLQEQPSALKNPWQFLQVQPSDRASRQLPIGTSIVQVWDAADGELLILGEPGSGKTTLLLELARTLLNRAASDENHPVPVIFNLYSWSRMRQPLVRWLVEELQTIYDIPRKIAQDLIDTDQILPLFDGLDEVTEDIRADCVKAINAHLQHRLEKGFAPLALSCRSQEYSALATQVMLQQAVSIQPLTNEQIEHYLQSVPGRLEGLQQVLRDDAELYELVHRPLMLNIFVQAYEGATSEEFPKEGRREALQHQIFARYVEHMLQRRIPVRYSKQQTLHWLSWLAKQMMLHSQTVFYIERIQLDWLPLSGLRSSRIVVGLIVGLIVGLAAGLPVGFINSLLAGLVGGLVVGLIFGLLFGMGWIRIGAIERFMSRIVLWRSGAMPLNSSRFLDDAVEHDLLQKVGKEYLFPHKSLMEYFASCDSDGSH